MGKLSSQRVAILVDAQNIYLSARARGAKPNYRKIMERINGRQVVRAIVYIIQSEGADVRSFIQALESMGYEVRSKKPRPLPDGTHKADWDMQIAIDALSLADKIDVMVILSGDSDFTPLVYALKSKGVKTEIMSFRETTGRELIEAANEYVQLNDEVLFK